ncbi:MULTISPECIES: hypothetical protein [Prochlorococcus]|uniref:hypothetical protein n=1 Tax=Prochlorococcus TaxID=1218 RepID=UPI001F1AB346|nr:hypothetical protein [Prochlorococcus marinus]
MGTSVGDRLTCGVDDGRPGAAGALSVSQAKELIIHGCSLVQVLAVGTWYAMGHAPDRWADQHSPLGCPGGGVSDLP